MIADLIELYTVGRVLGSSGTIEPSIEVWFLLTFVHLFEFANYTQIEIMLKESFLYFELKSNKKFYFLYLQVEFPILKSTLFFVNLIFYSNFIVHSVIHRNLLRLEDLFVSQFFFWLFKDTWLGGDVCDYQQITIQSRDDQYDSSMFINVIRWSIWFTLIYRCTI